MFDIYDINTITSLEVWVAVTELFPDSTYGAVPTIEQVNTVEAFRACDDGGLAEVPNALAAYPRNPINDSHYH